MMKQKNLLLILFSVGLILVGYFILFPPFTDEKSDGLFKPVEFKALEGWEEDDHNLALQAFILSCQKILKKTADAPLKPLNLEIFARDWFPVCKKSSVTKTPKKFFEEYFSALALNHPETPTPTLGTFTGYYAPEYDGSPVKTDVYTVPLYKIPSDLQILNLGQFDKRLSGKFIVGEVSNEKFVPYKNRKIIEEGALKEKGLELVWLKSAVDHFFLQIQGSGVIKFEDGSHFNVQYAGKNGRPYHSIGKFLIASGDVSKENMSMQAIRLWLEENPEKANDLYWKNPSFVFFTENKTAGTIGAMGVSLTAGRSLAVDNRYIPYGMPLWLDSTAQQTRIPSTLPQKLQRLVIAQDTGGAIRGAVRGDVFWGVGDEAAQKAGPMNDKGVYYLLVPKALSKKMLLLKKASS